MTLFYETTDKLHANVCSENFCVEGLQSVQAAKIVLENGEKALKFFKKLNLSILPPCSVKYRIIATRLETAAGIIYSSLTRNCVEKILLDYRYYADSYVLFHELAHAVIHSYCRKSIPELDESFAEALALLTMFNLSKLDEHKYLRLFKFVENSRCWRWSMVRMGGYIFPRYGIPHFYA